MNDKIAKHSNEFATEAKLVNYIISNNFQGLNELDRNALSSAYGRNVGDNIVKNAKLRLVYLSFQNLKSVKEISFEKLSKDLKIDIEDIEEVLFDAEENNLFKVKIDYERSILLIRYIRRLTFDQQAVEEMRSSVVALREKMGLFVKKMDNLII